MLPQVPAHFNADDYHAQPYRHGNTPADQGPRADPLEQAQIQSVQAVAAQDDPDNRPDIQGEPATTENRGQPVFNGA